MTGGSFANISESNAIKLSTFDLCSLISPIDLHEIQQTHIPRLSPMGQVMVIYPTVSCNMLSRSDNHVLCGSYIGYRCFIRVGMRDPYCYRVSIVCASEIDRDCAQDAHEECVCSIFKRCKLQ